MYKYERKRHREKKNHKEKEIKKKKKLDWLLGHGHTWLSKMGDEGG
jgi:hypothetical protein